MNTLYNQMLSAIADIEQGKNKEVALTFLKVATTLLDAQNDLIVEFVREADDKVTDLLQQNDKFVSAHRAAHAFGHDCPDAIKDREQLLTDVLAADKHDGFYGDKLQQMVNEILGDNVKVHVVHGGLAELADIIFGDKEKPKFN